jgi:hypothetical protein
MSKRSFRFVREIHMDWEKGVPGAMGRFMITIWSLIVRNVLASCNTYPFSRKLPRCCSGGDGQTWGEVYFSSVCCVHGKERSNDILHHKGF